MRRVALLLSLCISGAALGGESPPSASAAEAPFAVADDNRLDLAVSHTFNRDEAKTRITQLLTYWAERFGVKSEWHGFRVFLSGAVLGITIKAFFDVSEGAVTAIASDPGVLWRRAAERYVGGKLRKYLHPEYVEPAQ